METAEANMGNVNEILAWLIAISLMIYGSAHLKRLVNFILLKFYEYFFEHSY